VQNFNLMWGLLETSGLGPHPKSVKA
jgi:N-acetyl-gamma-glutamylphosphate reductase